MTVPPLICHLLQTWSEVERAVGEGGAAEAPQTPVRKQAPTR